VDYGAIGEAPARSRAGEALAHLLCARGKNGLEMRTLLFPRHHPDVDVFEARLFEEIVELHFAEAEPVIEVKLAGFLKLMAEQIEDDHAPIFSQQFCASNCARVPSPAPRSATVRGGSNVIRVWASACHDLPGT